MASTGVVAALRQQEADLIRQEAEFSTLVNPLIPIPHSITGITGIDNTMVKDAPTAREYDRLRALPEGWSKAVTMNRGYFEMVSHGGREDVPLWDAWWALVVALAAFGGEWILRRRVGLR